MARTEYERALAVRKFVEWAEDHADDVDEMETCLSSLVGLYIAGGGQIPRGLGSELDTVRDVLQLLPGVADDDSFDDLEERLDTLLSEYRSALSSSDSDSTMNAGGSRR